MNSNSKRLPLIDAMKGLSSQLIVLHHLVSYGPLAEALTRTLPLVAAWLFDYGRMVVQVFVVVGGYLAARSFAPDGVARVSAPLSLLARRYARLVPPFALAMLVAVAVAALVRLVLDDEMIPDAPTLTGFVAHALLLHGVLGVPALSAGVWYVAIDLQLFALLASLLWAASRPGSPAVFPWLAVAVAGMASLFVFNRYAGLDDWGIYFFGSYALGALVWYCGRQAQPLYWLFLLAAVGAIALATDFRPRIALALAVALALGLANARRKSAGGASGATLAAFFGWLGRISYAVFLVHFPVCMLVNAAFDSYGDDSDLAALAATIAAVIISTMAGAAFHRHVECRGHWLPRGITARWQQATRCQAARRATPSAAFSPLGAAGLCQSGSRRIPQKA